MRWIVFIVSACLLLSLSGNLYFVRNSIKSGNKQTAWQPENGHENSDMFHQTVLDSGLVISEHKKLPHESFCVESQYHILKLVTFPGDVVNLILADKKSGDSYTFIVFDKLGKAGKYNFSFPDFVSTDFDGDGLADWRQNSTQYEIRLNDEWVSCQKILPGQRKVLLSDGTGYEFKNGKWIPAVSDK